MNVLRSTEFPQQPGPLPGEAAFRAWGRSPPSTLLLEASVPGEGSRPLFPTRTGDKGGKEATYNLGEFHQGNELLSPAEILSELKPPTQALNFPSGFRHLSTPSSPNHHSVYTTSTAVLLGVSKSSMHDKPF